MPSEKDKARTNYNIETVANMWLTIEVSVFWIGVPLLPLTSQRKQFRKEFFHPLDDYIRASLASITTPDLMEIEKSLCEKKEDLEENPLLRQIELSFPDKLYFPLLSAGIIFTLIFCGTTPLSGSIIYSTYSAGSASLGAGIAGTVMVLERTRIQGLRNILQNELKRRKGKFGSFNGVPALSV